MSGSNQAVNISGMLNQIAGTLGSGFQFGDNNTGFAGSIRNSLAPQLDTNDPKSLEEYAEWARRNGNPEEAMRYRQMAERQREKTRELGIQRAFEASKARYRNALVSQDPARIAQEENIMSKFGEQYGVKATEAMSNVMSDVRTEEAANLRMKTDKLRLDSLEKATKEEADAKQLTTQLQQIASSTGVDSAAFNAFKQNNPLAAKYPEVVQDFESSELRLANERERRENQKAELSSLPSLSYATSLVNDPRVNDPALSKNLKDLESQLESKKSGGSDVWDSLAEKRMFEKNLKRLEDQAMRRLQLEESAERQKARSIENNIRNIEADKALVRPTVSEIKTETEAVRDALTSYGVFKPSSSEAIDDEDKLAEAFGEEAAKLYKGKTPAEIASMRVIEEKQRPYDTVINSLRAELSSTQGETTEEGRLKVGDVESGYRFLGGDPKDPNSWEPVE